MAAQHGALTWTEFDVMDLFCYLSNQYVTIAQDGCSIQVQKIDATSSDVLGQSIQRSLNKPLAVLKTSFSGLQMAGGNRNRAVLSFFSSKSFSPLTPCHQTFPVSTSVLKIRSSLLGFSLNSIIKGCPLTRSAWEIQWIEPGQQSCI
jgi:hypothetical protein